MDILIDMSSMDDGREIYQDIRDNIIVRRFNYPDDIPEFPYLPTKIQQPIKILALNKGANFDYVTLRDSGYFYSTNYVVVIRKEEYVNWIGWFTYRRPAIIEIFQYFIGSSDDVHNSLIASAILRKLTHVSIC